MDPTVQQVPQPLEQFVPQESPQQQTGLPKNIVLSFFAVIILLMGGMIFYIVSVKNTSTKKTAAVTKAPIVSAIQLTTQYTNPFDASTQTSNPFETPQNDNPFNGLSQ